MNKSIRTFFFQEGGGLTEPRQVQCAFLSVRSRAPTLMSLYQHFAAESYAYSVLWRIISIRLSIWLFKTKIIWHPKEFHSRNYTFPSHTASEAVLLHLERCRFCWLRPRHLAFWLCLGMLVTHAVWPLTLQVQCLWWYRPHFVLSPPIIENESSSQCLSLWRHYVIVWILKYQSEPVFISYYPDFMWICRDGIKGMHFLIKVWISLTCLDLVDHIQCLWISVVTFLASVEALTSFSFHYFCLGSHAMDHYRSIIFWKDVWFKEQNVWV